VWDVRSHAAFLTGIHSVMHPAIVHRLSWPYFGLSRESAHDGFAATTMV
jgi:hypothetical protein